MQSTFLSVQPGWRFTGDLVMQNVFNKAGSSEDNSSLDFSSWLQGALRAFQRLSLQVAAPGKVTLISGFSVFQHPHKTSVTCLQRQFKKLSENPTKTPVLTKHVLSWPAVLSRTSGESWRERPILPEHIQGRAMLTCHLFCLQAGNSPGEASLLPGLPFQHWELPDSACAPEFSWIEVLLNPTSLSFLSRCFPHL